jgi:Cu/Zn superoxide dismutase
MIMRSDSNSGLAVSSALLTIGFALGVVPAAGCTTEQVPMAPLGDAEASIGRSVPDIPVLGEGDFEEQIDGVVMVEIAVEGTPPGLHAVHVHELGDCSDGGLNAGGDWDPEGTGQESTGHALGDIGDIAVRDDGVGNLEFATDEWTVGDGSLTDVMGKAVIIHAGPADDPSGPGAPIGCGIIEQDID